MNDTYISFYLKTNRLHIFVDALRKMDSPRFICFMMGKDGRTLLMTPYPKKDYHSHRVPFDVYNGKKSLELNSIRLCKIISGIYNWKMDCSYRVPGTIISAQKIVMFYLDRAEQIGHDIL